MIKCIPIYFLTSIYYFSAGQSFQIQMQGECLDGNIDADTHVTFIGNMNNLLTGFTVPVEGVPINPFGPNLTGTDPVFRYTYESDVGQYRVHQKIMTSEYINQIAPNLVLPHGWDIIYRDLGYEPNQCPYLHPGTPNPAVQATWKDSWLEVVLRLILK